MTTVAFSRGKVRANGLELAFLEVGDGPLALCLHGFPDHARSFRHQLPVLAGAGYRAVAPWMRGYAPSEIPGEGPYHVPALAQDALALIDALGDGEPAVVLGHDWGALAAYGAATISPGKVRRLVTLAVPLTDMGAAFLGNAEQQRRSWYMFFFQTALAVPALAHDDFALVRRLWRDWSPGWELSEDEMSALIETLSEDGVLEAAVSYYRHTFAAAGLSPWPLPERSAELREIESRLQQPSPVSQPTLYLHGAEDGCIGAELAEGMEASFTGSLEKVIVPGTGHFLHQEKPDEINERILAFLEG